MGHRDASVPGALLIVDWEQWSEAEEAGVYSDPDDLVSTKMLACVPRGSVAVVLEVSDNGWVFCLCAGNVGWMDPCVFLGLAQCASAAACVVPSSHDAR